MPRPGESPNPYGPSQRVAGLRVAAGLLAAIGAWIVVGIVTAHDPSERVSAERSTTRADRVPATEIPPSTAPPTAPPTTVAPTTLATTTTAPPTTQLPNCNPNYDPCVPNASDVDCPEGTGDGPGIAPGEVRVIGADVYALDADGDGFGCDGQ